MAQETGIDDIQGNELQDNGIVSHAFIARGIKDTQSAFRFVKQLPYRRNGDKAALCVVLDEGCGTCSTKHALLYRLAQEQQLKGFELFMGIFRMNGDYAPKLRTVLEEHGLPYIPEAHCYLKYNGAILDCTNERSSAADFLSQLVTETGITPEQTGDFKVAFQKQYMQRCIETEPAFQHITIEELWAAREVCISLLG